MPKLFRLSALLCGAAALLAMCGGFAAAQTVPQDAVIEGFVKHLSADTALPAEIKKQALDLVQALRADPDGKSIAVTEALRLLQPDYQAALALLAEENFDAAGSALAALSKSPHPFLAADAAYYLARTRILAERFEESLPLLADLQTKQAPFSAYAGETLFLQGVAEAQLLRRPDAIKTLTKFLEKHPDSPERMRVAAFRTLEQLKLIEDGALSDVQMRMDFSRRKLSLEDSGAETRKQQDKIIELLAKLIEEAEKRESSGKGSGKGDGKKQPKQGEGSEGDSQAEGQGQGQGGNSGGGSKGTDSDTVKRLQRGGPQSPWSHLRDKERDPVFSAIKEKFPGRYQQLIEQYYKSFQDDSEG